MQSVTKQLREKKATHIHHKPSIARELAIDWLNPRAIQQCFDDKTSANSFFFLNIRFLFYCNKYFPPQFCFFFRFFSSVSKLTFCHRQFFNQITNMIHRSVKVYIKVRKKKQTWISNFCCCCFICVFHAMWVALFRKSVNLSLLSRL